MRPVLNALIPEFNGSPRFDPEPLGIIDTLKDAFSSSYSYTRLPLSTLIWVKGNLCKADLLTQVLPKPECTCPSKVARTPYGLHTPLPPSSRCHLERWAAGQLRRVAAAPIMPSKT